MVPLPGNSGGFGLNELHISDPVPSAEDMGLGQCQGLRLTLEKIICTPIIWPLTWEHAAIQLTLQEEPTYLSQHRGVSAELFTVECLLPDTHFTFSPENSLPSPPSEGGKCP